MSSGQGSAAEPVGAIIPEELSVAEPLRGLELVSLQQQAEQFVRAAKAPSTLKAYRSDWDISAAGAANTVCARCRPPPKP